MADNATNQITAAQAAAAAASGIPSPGQSTPPPSPHILDNTMFGPVSADAAAYAAPATASLDAKTPSPFDKIPGQTTLYAGPTGTYSIPKDEPPQEGPAQSKRVFGPWDTYEPPKKPGEGNNPIPGIQGNGNNPILGIQGNGAHQGEGNYFVAPQGDPDENNGVHNPAVDPYNFGLEIDPKFFPFLQKSAHMLGQGGEIMSRLISHSTIPTRSDVMQEQDYNANQAELNRNQQLKMLQHDNEYNQDRMKIDNLYKMGQIDEKGVQDRLEQATIAEQARQTFRENLSGNLKLTAAAKGPGGIPTPQSSIH